MNDRAPWICPRCDKVNAPHNDHCDCAGGDVIGIPIPPPMPYIPPMPAIPYWWWTYPLTPTAITDDKTIIYTNSQPVITRYATNGNDALFTFGSTSTTAQ